MTTLFFDVAREANSAALELVFPSVCRLCDQGVDRQVDFCCRCETALTRSESMMRAACLRCGQPRAGALPASHSAAASRLDSGVQRRGNAEPATAGDGCPRCRATGFCFDAVVPMWAYLDRVREAIVAAKFAHHGPLGDALGRRLAQHVVDRTAVDRPHLVTFVPSHFTRRISRGGNGNQTIATAVAGGIGVRCRSLLKTTRRIAKQAWLNESERVNNVRGAFAVKKSYAHARPSKLANQHILLVDDVMTTGATASEVAAVLKEAGADRVTVAVVARAIS